MKTMSELERYEKSIHCLKRKIRAIWRENMDKIGEKPLGGTSQTAHDDYCRERVLECLSMLEWLYEKIMQINAEKAT